MNNFFDFNTSNWGYEISNSTAIDSEGNMLFRMNDTMAMDINSGDLHMTSTWSEEKDDN